MTIDELKKQLRPGVKISLGGKTYTILQHILWWQAKMNETYDKYVLEDEIGNNTYRLYISGEGSFIGFATLIRYDFKEPMPKELTYENRRYILTQNEFCIVRRSEGKEFYHVADAEIWWDYISDTDDGTGLSLGRNWETWEREDLKTQEVKPDDILFVPLDKF